jgi:chaperonin cofactor prefoldin
MPIHVVRELAALDRDTEPTPEMYRNAGELVYKMCARIARDKAVAQSRSRIEAKVE